MRTATQRVIRRGATLASVAVASVALVAPLAAQDAPASGAPGVDAILPGTRVRITGTRDGPREATFIALRRDTALVRWRPGQPDSLVPLAGVTRLEVSRGQRSRTWAGAGIGLLTGAVVGGVLGAASYTGCDPDQGFCIDLAGSPSSAAAGGAVVVGGVGFLVGAVIGAFVRTDDWRAVPLARVRVGRLRPPPGARAGLALAVTF